MYILRGDPSESDLVSQEAGEQNLHGLSESCLPSLGPIGTSVYHTDSFSMVCTL